jgi:hypothetical protein
MSSLLGENIYLTFAEVKSNVFGNDEGKG